MLKKLDILHEINNTIDKILQDMEIKIFIENINITNNENVKNINCSNIITNTK